MGCQQLVRSALHFPVCSSCLCSRHQEVWRSCCAPSCPCAFFRSVSLGCTRAVAVCVHLPRIFGPSPTSTWARTDPFRRRTGLFRQRRDPVRADRLRADAAGCVPPWPQLASGVAADGACATGRVHHDLWGLRADAHDEETSLLLPSVAAPAVAAPLLQHLLSQHLLWQGGDCS